MSEPIPVTTFEEVQASRVAKQEAEVSFFKTYLNYLNSALSEVGFRNKLVRLKAGGHKGLEGQFRVIESGFPFHPYEVKFYPRRKSDGGISEKSKWIGLYSWDEEHLAENLKSIAEVVGDLP